jgi:putative transposase
MLDAVCLAVLVLCSCLKHSRSLVAERHYTKGNTEITKLWKQNINLGKKTNQAFCFVPTHLLLEKVKYKATIAGIDVTFTEESYTSKASFYDRDSLPAYEKGVVHTFSGKRKHRGLYVSKDGFAVNADVNGSMNIGRKVIPEFFGIGDRSIAAMPVVVNPLKA